MKVRVACFIAVCLLTLMISETALAQEKDLEREVEKIGFSALIPPRNGFNPGLIYRKIKDAQGRQQNEVLCQNVFLDTPDAVVTSDWILTKRTYKTGVNLSMLLQWLPNALSAAPAMSGEAGAALDFSKLVNVSFGGVKHSSAPVEKRFDKSAPVTLSNACKNAIDAHKKADPKLRNLYIVAETLTSSQIHISLNKKVAAKLNLDLKLNELVTAKPGVGYTYDADGSIIGPPNVPIVFAYYAVRIKDYSLPSGAVSDGSRLIQIELDVDSEID